MPGGTMKTQNEQWGQRNNEVSFHIILKPMLLRGTFFFLFTQQYRKGKYCRYDS